MHREPVLLKLPGDSPAAIALVLFLLVSSAGAASPLRDDPIFAAEEAKLSSSSPAAGDALGFSVSIGVDTVVVGATGDGFGSVLVFRRNGTGWQEEAKLTASDATSATLFGHSVAIFGDTVLVGAPHDDQLATNSGAAYVFVRSGSAWTQQAKLLPGGATFLDNFGWSVAIGTDTAVIGAPLDGDLGTNAGSAYVAVRTGSSWSVPDKLTALDAAAHDEFGYAVSLSGETVVVGARKDDDDCPAGFCDTGSAYVFTRSGGNWSQQAKLTASDARAGNNFGLSVSVYDDTAAVGAPFADDVCPVDPACDSGSVYIYARSGGNWSQQAKLNASDAQVKDYFGSSVSLSAGRVLIGAPRSHFSNLGVGSAYIFELNASTWCEQNRLIAADAQTLDGFGQSVSMTGDSVVTGAPGEDGDGGPGLSGAGAAYAFRLSPAGWANLGNALAGLHGDPLLTGLGPLTGGIPVTVALSAARENTSAILLLGLSPLFAPFSGGVMVPLPQFIFSGIPTGSDGEVILTLPWPTGIPPATDLYLQYWIIDSSGPFGLAASNGLLARTP